MRTTPRTFWQYNKDNWPVFIPFIGGLVFAPLALADGARGTAGFFLLVSLVCVLGSYLDWKRLG